MLYTFLFENLCSVLLNCTLIVTIVFHTVCLKNNVSSYFLTLVPQKMASPRMWSKNTVFALIFVSFVDFYF